MDNRSTNGTTSTTPNVRTADLSASRDSVPVTVADGAWHCDPSDPSPRRGRSPIAKFCILTAIFILTPPWFLLLKEVEADQKLSLPASELWEAKEDTFFRPLEKELFADDVLRARLRERRGLEVAREKTAPRGYLHVSETNKRQERDGSKDVSLQLDMDADMGDRIVILLSSMDLAPPEKTSWWCRPRAQHLNLIIFTFLLAGIATLMPLSTSTGARLGMLIELTGACLLCLLPNNPWTGYMVLGVGAEVLFDALVLWVCRLPDAPLMLSLLGAGRLVGLVAWHLVTRTFNSCSLLIGVLVGAALAKLLLLTTARLPHRTDLEPPGIIKFDAVEVWLDFLTRRHSSVVVLLSLAVVTTVQCSSWRQADALWPEWILGAVACAWMGFVSAYLTHMVPLMVMSISLVVLSASLIVSSPDSIAVAAVQCAASCLTLPLLVCGQVSVIANQQLPSARSPSDMRNRNLLIRLTIVCTRWAASFACVLVLLLEHATLPPPLPYGPTSSESESLVVPCMFVLNASLTLLAFIMSVLTQLHRTC